MTVPAKVWGMHFALAIANHVIQSAAKNLASSRSDVARKRPSARLRGHIASIDAGRQECPPACAAHRAAGRPHLHVRFLRMKAGDEVQMRKDVRE